MDDEGGPDFSGHDMAQPFTNVLQETALDILDPKFWSHKSKFLKIFKLDRSHADDNVKITTKGGKN